MPDHAVIAGSLATGVVVADYIYRRYASGRIQEIVENVPTFAAVPTPAIPDRPTFSVRTDDGCQLEGCVHLPSEPPVGVILFCPELNANHWTSLHYAPALIDAGFAVVSFNFRCQPGSEAESGTARTPDGYRPIHWVTEFELLDIRAVLDYIRRDATLAGLPVGLFGVSRGGSAALVAACRYEQVEAVVTDSAYAAMPLIRSFMHRFSRFVVPDWFFSRLPAWHIDLVLRQALRRSERARGCRYVHLEREVSARTVPTLLIAGSRDSYVTQRVTDELAACLSDHATVWTVHRARHNKARDRQPEEYDRRIVQHFRQQLPSGSKEDQSSDDASSQDSSSAIRVA